MTDIDIRLNRLQPAGLLLRNNMLDSLKLTKKGDRDLSGVAASVMGGVN